MVGVHRYGTHARVRELKQEAAAERELENCYQGCVWTPEELKLRTRSSRRR